MNCGDLPRRPAVAAATARRRGSKLRRSTRLFVLPTSMVSLLVAGVLIGSGAGASSAATCANRTGAQPPSPGTFSELEGVAAISRCSAWAVGFYNNNTADQTMIDHWNGSAWVQQSSPNPGGTAEHNELTGVTATSTKNAWAVGYYFDGKSNATLIEHWNGKTWTRQPSPDPGNPSFLNAVTATSASNAWAVGQYYHGAVFRTLIEHWNGSTWKRVSSPTVDRRGDDLSSVAATSAKDAWAVGSYYNGRTSRTLIEHWNGRTWKHVSSPNPSALLENVLDGVTIVSAKNAWAVGYYSNGLRAVTVILHWNGRAWKHVTSPNPVPTTSLDLDYLSGVKAVSAGNAWAVGYYYNGSNYVTLIAHWNGHSWAQVSSPTINNYSELYAIGGDPATGIWTVGQYYNGSENQGLTLRCC
jgi:hypothetical protein